MRTTVVIDDALLRAAKARAARAGISLSRLISEALRETLTGKEHEAPNFEMITYGRHGSKARHEPADFARALEDEDRAGLDR